MKKWWSLVVAQLICVTIVVQAPPALAVTCIEASSTNFGVGAGPSVSITASKGVLGITDVRGSGIHLEPWGGGHVESIYLWNDFSNMVEYGFTLERPQLTYDGPFLVDARLFDGVYANRLHSISETNHTLTIIYDSVDARFDFRLDGVPQAYHRDPIWAQGRPFAVGEISNQCDTGLSHWWNLRRLAAGVWAEWVGTHWNCDTETDYGYKEISNTDFRVYDPSDTFTGGCDFFA